MAYKGKRGKKGTFKKSDEGKAPIKDGAESGTFGDTTGRNDISWYTRYPQLVAAAGTFPYPYRPGMDINLYEASTKTYSMEIPGVMSLQWLPSIGISKEATDPASVLGKEMYARVRNAYSGRLYADAPDYVMYILALDGIFSYIAWLKRLYRILAVWSPENRLVPDRILKGMGLCDEDIVKLRAEKVQLWQYINELVLQSRKWTCPSGIDYINRHYWMNDNVYTDDATINSQFYMFNMQGVYSYGVVDYEDPEAENPVPIMGMVMKYMPWYRILGEDISTKEPNVLSADWLYRYGIDLINALNEWDDSYTINGYLSRAYEGQALFIVEEEPLMSEFVPKFEPEVLMQIENSTTIPYGYGHVDLKGMNVGQDVRTNAILCSNTLTFSGVAPNTFGENMLTVGKPRPFISCRAANPGPLENVIATRLKSFARSVSRKGSDSAGYTFTVVVDSATEIALSWQMVSDNVNMATASTIIGNAVPTFVSYYDPDPTATKALMKIMDMSNFDWHPMILVAHVASSAAVQPDGLHIFGDVHNITTITMDQLDELHKICLFSEFNSFSMS